MEITYQGLRVRFRELYRTMEARVRFLSTQAGCLTLLVALGALGIHQPVLAVGLLGATAGLWALGWRTRWRRRAARWWIGQRLDAQGFPLDQETLEDCLRLGPLPRRLEQYMDEALQVYADLRELLFDPAWKEGPGLPSDALQTVEGNMEALIGLVRVLRRAYRVLREHGDHFDPALRRRMGEQYARQSQELGAMIAAFRQAYAHLAEAVLAASDAQDRARRMRTELEEFAAAMQRLASGLREAEAVLTPELAETERLPHLTGEEELDQALLAGN